MSHWLLGRCPWQLRCADANMAYSRAEHVFILEHYFATKSFAAVREAFSNAYRDKEVPNKTIHQVVTTFRETESVCVPERRWWTSAIKLFCNFFLITTKKQLVCLLTLM
jgi:hypothetical protein